MKFYETLNIKKGINSFVGGGGKTSSIDKIARELYSECKSVVFTTTTRIFPPDEDFYGKSIINPSEKDIIKISKKGICAVGKSIDEKGKLTGVSEKTLEYLEKYFDYVLVEADGSKRMPIKIPASHEPVIPKNSKHTICVIGFSSIGKKVSDCCFRYELKNINKDIVVTNEFIENIIVSKDCLLKNINENKFTVLINQSDINIKNAIELANNINKKGIENVVISSLKNNYWERI